MNTQDTHGPPKFLARHRSALLVTLIAVLCAGDAGEPVITIRRPDNL